MFVNHAAFEEGRRHQQVTVYDIVPRQSAEQKNYQILAENIPSMFKEDCRIIQNKEKIDFWIEEKAKAWCKISKLLVNTPQQLFSLSGNPSAESESKGDNCFLFFDDFEDKLDNAMSEQFSTSSYDAFGLLVKNSDTTVINFFREGTSHAGDKGKLVGQSYNLTTKTWGTRYDVYEDATYDSRNIGGGIIGSHIFIFFARYNYTTAAWIDIGFIKSTDLTGTSWGSYTTIDVSPLTVFSPYGHIASTSDSNTFLQPFYGWNGSTYSVKLFKTTDNGDNWSVGSTIYSGTTHWTETCVAYIGSSKMIALLRNDAGGYVAQATSADNGTNWSGVSNTNMGASTNPKVPYIIYDSENTDVIAIYFDKASPYSVKISKSDANTVYASASSWASPSTLDSWGIPRNGYPSIVKLSTGTYFLNYAKEVSASDTDMWGGYYIPGYGPSTDKWDIVGTPAISISNSIMAITCNAAEYLESKTFTQAPPAILEARSKDKNYGARNYPATYGFGHYHGVTYDTYGVRRDVYSNAQYMLVANDNLGRDITGAIARNTNFAKYKIEWTSAICHIYEDGVKKDSDDVTTHIPTGSLKAVIGRTYYAMEANTFDIDWVLVRKSASPEPLILKKRIGGKADVIKAIVSGIVA